MTEEINWGYNCLTDDVHHGRPEAIWNLPLLQTTFMFSPVQLQTLVVDRIYNDAMQYVNASSFTQEGTEATTKIEKAWAERVRDIAAPQVLRVYQRKVGEITTYYRSLQFKRELDDAIERNQANKLNSFYQPLHSHDTLNMLCRIVATGAKFQAVN